MSRPGETRSGRTVGGMPIRLTAFGALVLVSLALATSLAAAAEVTRDSYREAVEPICKSDTQANERIFAGVKREVRQGRLKPAALKFAKAAAALKSAIDQIQKVPAPAADAARLSKWLGKISNEAGYFEAVSKKLRSGDKAGAEHLVNKLTTEAGAANNVVIPFEFTYCRLEPSRFT